MKETQRRDLDSRSCTAYAVEYEAELGMIGTVGEIGTTPQT
jgi:hypothetical protein